MDSINSFEKPYRLFNYCPNIDNNICAFLLEVIIDYYLKNKNLFNIFLLNFYDIININKFQDFKKSESPYSYFALVPGIFQKGEYSKIYYNQITKECLRIMPAIMSVLFYKLLIILNNNHFILYSLAKNCKLFSLIFGQKNPKTDRFNRKLKNVSLNLINLQTLGINIEISIIKV